MTLEGLELFWAALKSAAPNPHFRRQPLEQRLFLESQIHTPCQACGESTMPS